MKDRRRAAAPRAKARGLQTNASVLQLQRSPRSQTQSPEPPGFSPGGTSPERNRSEPPGFSPGGNGRAKARPLQPKFLPVFPAVDAWERADERAAAQRLASASNDVGLTGVVFLRDIETHEPEDSDTLTVRVRSNRPLTTLEEDIVRSRLLDS